LVLVVLREWIRSLVVKACGGTADDLTLWPLGSVEGVHPASGWRAAVAAGLAGPCTSIVVLLGLALPIGLATGEWRGSAFPDPLSDAWLRNPHAAWLETLWIIQRTGLQLALINCLPMLPLDGGYFLQAVTERRDGSARQGARTAEISMGVAAAVAILSILMDVPALLAVGILCFVHAALVRRQHRLVEAMMPAFPAELDSHFSNPSTDSDPQEDRQERARQKSAQEARELDRILDKIAREGISSLSRAEQATLQEATQRRRGGSGDRKP
jgi:Zn-dependent protease